MKINRKLIKFIIAPWVVVGALAVGVLFILGCGGDTSIDQSLINFMIGAVEIALILNAIGLVAYLSIPHIAGLVCVWLAKNWKKMDQLATLSASLKYDATVKGGYYKLYKKGVKTYNNLNRGVTHGSAKSRAV